MDVEAEPSNFSRLESKGRESLGELMIRGGRGGRAGAVIETNRLRPAVPLTDVYTTVKILTSQTRPMVGDQA